MSQNNDNPQNVPEFERIKWLISRIDLYHKINIESADTSKNIFDNAAKKSSSQFHKKIKMIFSINGFFLSLIMGLNALNYLEPFQLYSGFRNKNTAGFVV